MILRKGDEGKLVRKLQTALGLKVTGYFDGKTDSAVRSYQKEAGLTPDGIVGSKTYAYYLSHPIKKGIRKLVPNPRPKAGDNVKAIMLNEVFSKSKRTRRLLNNAVFVLDQYSELFSLNTLNREVHFWAQVAIEVGYNITLEENLNYSPKGLKNTFKAYRHNTLLANKHGRTLAHKADQEAIANIAYGNRYGNGGFKTGDGWKFRGRGGKMVTFHDNYESEEKFVKRFLSNLYDNGYTPLLDPDKLSSEDYWILSAAIFWKRKGLYMYADKGISYAASKRITSKVNYYTHSYKDRFKMLQRITGILK